MRVFPHNHLGKLTRLLEGSDGESLDVVITESIFSMDGDAADLRGLVELKAKFPFVLMVDEAHGSGVYGKNGAGYAHECGLHEAVDISIVTFSKALGGIGAAICSSRQFGEAVVNFGRAFIYTTNLPASAAAAAEAAIGVLHDQPERQIRLRKLSRQTREKLTAAGVNMPAGDSPILCVIVGAESAALEAAGWLQKEGLLVSAVRPPTVAVGRSRLRVTLCSDHTDEEVKRLIAALIRFGKP
jgi:8-amino-7-oxononanoate synthase